MTDREHALEVLSRVEREGAFASPLIESLNVDERDRRFVRTLVYAVLRWRSAIDAEIELLARRRLNRLDRTTLDILRLGVAQIRYTDVPPHAVVNEMVRIAQRRAARSKGLVNAVLRAATREAAVPTDDSATTVTAIARTTSHPEWMIERWASFYGLARTAEIARANQGHSFPDLLVNPRRHSREEYLGRLLTRGIDARAGVFHPWFVALASGTAPVRDDLQRGDVYAMDEGSALVATLVSPSARRVLDVSAAPGGKSIALALAGREVIAHDVSLPRLQMLRTTAPAMLGAALRIVAGDGRQLAFRDRFDSVLLDAPCSATGTIRRSPEIKWRLTRAMIEEFASLQRALLSAALSGARDECVYSTCSLEPEENDAVVDDVLMKHPEFERGDASIGVPASLAPWFDRGVLRLTPDSGCDGFTVHKLIRKKQPI